MVARYPEVLVDERSADERIAVSGELALAPEAFPETQTSTGQAALPSKQRAKSAVEWSANQLAEETNYGTEFLFLPVWFGGGALCYFSLKAEPSLYAIAALCVLFFLIGRIFQHIALARAVLLAMLFGCLGAAAAKIETLRFATVMMGSEVTTRIAGTLVRAEEVTKGRTRLVIDIHSTERPKLKFAPERIRVSARGNFASIEAGSNVTGLVKLFALSGPVRPGAYDFAFESYFDGVGAAGFFLGKPAFSPPVTATTITETMNTWRNQLTTHIRSIVPGETGAVVAALVTGVRGAVSEADNEALRRSGLAHIMSISGLHLALAAGVLIAAIRLGFALMPSIVNTWPVKKLAASAGIVMAILYCLLSGSEVATVRSTIMIVVMLGAVLVERPAITMRNLAIAALILLAVWPHEIAGPGFQMSFAATAGLIAIYRWWARRPVEEKQHQHSFAWRIASGIKTATIGTILSSTVAGFATLPFGAFHFERLAPWGTLSNLLALPAISIIVMPSAVAAMVAMPFGLDAYVWPIMASGVEFMLGLAHWIAGFGGPDATGPVPVFALLLSTLGLVVFCLPQTQLRWLGLAPLSIAFIIVVARQTPAAFITESASLIGYVTKDGDLAVSATRPDEFATKNWQRTVKAEHLLRPIGVTDFSDSFEPDDGFSCSKTLCIGEISGGLRLAYAKSVESLETACSFGDLVVQGFAGPPTVCPNKAIVITSGMLARHGSAAIYQDENATETNSEAIGWRDAPITYIQTESAKYRVEWSYTALNRPWQTQRVFSRPARDLAPKPKPQQRVFSGTGMQGRV